MTKYKFLVDDDLDLTVNKFIDNCKIMKSSKVSYRMAIRLFLDWLIKQEITEPIKQNILDYKMHLKEKNLSTFTIHVYLNAIRVYFRWLDKSGYYDNIAEAVHSDRFPEGNLFYKKHLTPRQILKLLDSVDTSTITGLRDFALINTMARTGLRSIEVSRANLEDIKIQDDEVRLYVQRKGSSTRNNYVLLTDKTHEPIQKYLEIRLSRGSMNHGKEPLFASHGNNNLGGRLSPSSVSHIVKTYLRKAGFNGKGYSCHSLRHSAISMVIKGGGSLMTASKLAGHTNPAVTSYYNHNKVSIDKPGELSIDSVLEKANGRK